MAGILAHLLTFKKDLKVFLWKITRGYSEDVPNTKEDSPDRNIHFFIHQNPCLGMAKSLSWAVTKYCVEVCWAVTKYQVGVGWPVTKYGIGVGWAITKYRVGIGWAVTKHQVGVGW